MLVLGITDGVSCGAAVVHDGEILSAVNEEALTRLKMAYGFPRRSIREVMEIAGIEPSDIDLVTVATVNNHLFNGIKPWKGWLRTDRGWLRNTFARGASELSGLIDVPGVEQLYYGIRAPVFQARRRTIRHIVRSEFAIDAEVEFVDHHFAHATSAYFTSGFDDAVVVTMDGGGDGASSHVYTVRDGVFNRIASTSAFNSVANYYAYVTQLCGFTAHKHEGKITGLAAHGEPIHLDLLDRMITFQNGRFRNVGRAMFHGGVRLLEKHLPRGWRQEDVAASIQIHCERLAVAYIRHQLALIPNAPKNIAIAGGLFANVRINQKIAEIPGIERLFVHPGMTDCGLAVGAALSPCAVTASGPRMGRKRKVIDDVYLGAGFSARAIEDELDQSGLAFDYHEEIEQRIAERLRDGYVVARFNGRMEYGPRALGNRSILYQPADPSVNDWLNKLLRRTEFMPYAPSTVVDEADRSYHNVGSAPDSARFMTVTFDCTEWMRQTCPGVVHVDGTARPQLVRAEDNQSYFKIIDEFRKLTGVGTVINTSFNMHEEPIVYSPADAIRAFRQGHLDYLAIGNFLVQSPDPPKHELSPMRSAREAKGVG